MSRNFGSSPGAAARNVKKKKKKNRKGPSFGIFVRECRRRHDVYSRLWTLRRVPPLSGRFYGEEIKSRAKQAGAMKSCVFNDMHFAGKEEDSSRSL